jgi:hypothetical protein
MDKQHHDRHSWRIVLASGAMLAFLAACGSDTEPPPAQIDPAPEVPSVIDDRPCAESPAQARAEKRTLCID